MNIKQIQSPTFQANKILTTQRLLKNGSYETIELFRLNHKDDYAFAKKCNTIFSQNISKKMEAIQKRLKDFFNDFLNKTSGDKDYFITIKNSEIINGGMISLPFDKKILLQNLFSACPKNNNNNALLYGLISDTQDNYKGYSISTFNWLKGNEKNELLPFDMNKTKRNIQKKSPEITYKLCNDEKFNLDDVLGTKDFETDILY